MAMDLTQCLRALEISVLERKEEDVLSSVAAINQKVIDSGELEELRKIVICLCQGDYLTALQGKTSQHLLQVTAVTADVNKVVNEISLVLKCENVNSSPEISQTLVLFIGVACLELFIQYNWTGPAPVPQLAGILPGTIQGNSQLLIFERLSQDGQPIDNPMIDVPLVLFLAKIILLENEKALDMCQTACLWALRCLGVQRQLFHESNEITKNRIFILMERVHKALMQQLTGEINNRALHCQIHLELGYLYLDFYETKRAREHFSAAQSSVGIQVDLTGALGRRTKFQQQDVSQLVLLVQREVNFVDTESVESIQAPGRESLPKDVALNDDTLLEKVKFKDESLQQQIDKSATAISPCDQAVILGLTVECQKSQAQHRLNTEEMLAYLEVITNHPKAWCVNMVALLMRSRLEKELRRKMERSMMQLQALLESIENHVPEVTDRQLLFYCVPLPPKWEIKRDLAKLLFQMGAVKGALDIFQQIHAWEDVVYCYQSLGWYSKAEALIRQQLKIKETAFLWCLLGDTLKDASCYEKAWELSGHHSSRAQRSLGFLYLKDKEYAKSIPCFQKSLEINSLQGGVWFSLGCAALATDALEVAATAFHRCVSLDSRNAEAWNNLSHVYIKKGQKSRAHLTLKESLKGNYESWHVWENFLLVSVDVGSFSDAITAYHRLMDLRDKYCDVEIIGILVKAVNQGLLDCNKKSASDLRPNLLKLMGRLTSQVTNNSEVWKLYSDLCWKEKSQEDREKALHFLVKAHRTRTQSSGWENDISQFKEVIALTLHLSDGKQSLLLPHFSFGFL
ncbi:tetratricopeptide repeat protein 27-like [Montipora capricornis]|uniref:tetratricopeptide repeat protein 27-like n=1 Tax=Montipora capricornis TaxID=246305 RepID=UPI0035F1F916